MTPSQVQKLIDASVAKERRRLANQIDRFITDRFTESHPNGKELDVWCDKKLTFWDIKMLAKEMRFP